MNETAGPSYVEVSEVQSVIPSEACELRRFERSFKRPHDRSLFITLLSAESINGYELDCKSRRIFEVRVSNSVFLDSRIDFLLFFLSSFFTFSLLLTRLTLSHSLEQHGDLQHLLQGEFLLFHFVYWSEQVPQLTVSSSTRYRLSLAIR